MRSTCARSPARITPRRRRRRRPRTSRPRPRWRDGDAGDLRLRAPGCCPRTRPRAPGFSSTSAIFLPSPPAPKSTMGRPQRSVERRRPARPRRRHGLRQQLLELSRALTSRTLVVRRRDEIGSCGESLRPDPPSNQAQRPRPVDVRDVARRDVVRGAASRRGLRRRGPALRDRGDAIRDLAEGRPSSEPTLYAARSLPFTSSVQSQTARSVPYMYEAVRCAVSADPDRPARERASRMKLPIARWMSSGRWGATYANPRALTGPFAPIAQRSSAARFLRGKRSQGSSDQGPRIVLPHVRHGLRAIDAARAHEERRPDLARSAKSRT